MQSALHWLPCLKLVTSALPCQSQEGTVLALHQEHLVECLEVKPPKFKARIQTGPSKFFFTLKPVHTQPPEIQQNRHLNIPSSSWFTSFWSWGADLSCEDLHLSFCLNCRVTVCPVPHCLRPREVTDFQLTRLLSRYQNGKKCFQTFDMSDIKWKSSKYSIK